jgi:hypothetical protein
MGCLREESHVVCSTREPIEQVMVLDGEPGGPGGALRQEGIPRR